MTFPTSIQSLLGTNTPQNNANEQAVPDWPAMQAYIYGPNPTIAGNPTYLAVQNMNLGVEINAVSAGTFLSGSAFHEFPIGQDTAGNLYVTAITKALGQISSVTLTQIQAGVTDFAAVQGSISGLQATDGTKWILVCGTGVQTFFSYHGCYKVSDLSNWGPGSIHWDGTNGLGCAGILGAGIGWVIAQGNVDTLLNVYKINVNSGMLASTIIGSPVATDVDAAWTKLTLLGLCVDEEDGNILAALQGQTGATNSNYLVKLSATDASVIWKRAVPNSITLTTGLRMMQYSVVQNSRFYYMTNQGGGAGTETTVINTSTGAIVDQYTSGLSHVLMFSGTASNDNLGAVMGNMSLNVGSDGPTLRNATPSTFTGYAILYVAPGPPFPPASAGRKFLAELGPVKF
jgi:hypothetical protein